MKVTVFSATRLAMLLICALSTLAGAQTKADITLEGPWILYVDNSAQKWPVLVVISPGGVSDDNDLTYFHTISIDNGDGYPALNPGVYCLAFDGACTPQPACSSTSPPSCPTSLSPDSYPQIVPPLPASATSSWDWSHKWMTPKYATAFVLPMPDYYKADTGWYMRFSDQWDVTGAKYKVYKGKYASSVQLHYDKGPGAFNLQDCKPQPGDNLNLSQCANLPNTGFDNIGTLHLTMRSPESNDACDPHVRRAYPSMIGLLDGDNSMFKVIDLAHGVQKDGKTPIFDANIAASEVGTKGYRCLEHDYQGGASPDAAAHFHARTQVLGQKSTSEASTWLNQLGTLDQFIKEFQEELDRDKDPQLKDPKLLLNEISDAYQKLDPAFPRFSQAAWIQTLLRNSMKEIDTVLSSKRFAGNKRAELSLAQLKKDENSLLGGGGPPTKSGNDCKAPVMLVQ